MKYTITITAPIEVPIERIEHTLCAALEGGSTYWCEGFKPDSYPHGAEYGHEAIARGAGFRIVHDETDVLEVMNEPGALEQALVTLAKKYPRHFGDMMGETEDAETGDILFQILCFGEVVYG